MSDVGGEEAVGCVIPQRGTVIDERSVSQNGRSLHCRQGTLLRLMSLL